MAEWLYGAPVAKAINARVRERAAALAARGTVPALAIVRVGSRDDDISYQRSAVKRCEGVGVLAKAVELPADVTQQCLIDALRRLNGDAAVHGVLLLRPLPAGIDDAAVRGSLLPEKDVDGVTDLSLAGVFAGTKTGYPPCTARACIEILDHYGIQAAGKRAVVVGRSLVVGRPVAMLLLARHATVTVCHTRTKDLAAVCREADILVAAAGQAGMVDKTFLSAGQVVLDVGFHVQEEGGVCGDVRQPDAQDAAAAFTPVPGGVGAVTTSVLAAQVVESALRAAGMP